MNLEGFRNYCLSKPGVTEEFPFNEETMVFKVMGKMFALTSIVAFERVSLKVDPEVGVEMRDRFQAVEPAWHMNKMHWVMILMDGTIPDKLLREWIDNSYSLVVGKLTKRDKLRLDKL